MTERNRIEITSSEHVTAISYPGTSGDRADIALILAHGAGASQTSGFHLTGNRVGDATVRVRRIRVERINVRAELVDRGVVIAARERLAGRPVAERGQLERAGLIGGMGGAATEPSA